MKRNKLNYICTKLSELDNYFLWLDHEFNLLGIKCTKKPREVSEYIKEFYNKVKEEEYNITTNLTQYEFSKLEKEVFPEFQGLIKVN